MIRALRSRLRLIGLAFLKVLIVAIITLIAVEGFLQVAFLRLPPPLIYAMPQYPVRLGIATDPASGARHFPANALVQHTVDGRSGDLYALSCLKQPEQPLFDAYSVDFTRDSLGFRNPPDLPENVDMVVIGDSFTEGESVQSPFWDGLAPTVYNLGLPDSGTLEQIALLRTYGLPRHPRTVVLAYFGGNDLENNLDYADLKQSGQTYEGRALSYPPLDYLIIPHLVAYFAIPRNTEGCFYPITDRNGTKLAFYNAFFGNAMLPPDELSSTNLWQTTERALRDMASAVKDSGARLIVVYIPYKAQTYFDELYAATFDQLRAQVTPEQFGFTAEQSLPLERWAVDAQNLLLAELADQVGFTFLDLTSIFRQHAAAGESLYFYGDTHWNQNGHDLAREQISLISADSQ